PISIGIHKTLRINLIDNLVMPPLILHVYLLYGGRVPAYRNTSPKKTHFLLSVNIYHCFVWPQNSFFWFCLIIMNKFFFFGPFLQQWTGCCLVCEVCDHTHFFFFCCPCICKDLFVIFHQKFEVSFCKD